MIDEKDREIWVGENRLYLGEDNIIYLTLVSKMDDKTAIKLVGVSQKLENMVEGKVDFLVDLNNVGKQSPMARKIFRDRAERSEKLGKTATFGLHPVARVVASFVIGTLINKDCRFFRTKEEALEWLKEENEI